MKHKKEVYKKASNKQYTVKPSYREHQRDHQKSVH